MNMTKYLTLCVAVLVFSFSSFAQTAPTSFPNIDIVNFGQMDEHLYRGAQPEPGDYPALKALGVTTIIDLRNDPTDYEKKEAEALGMKYVNIPMSGWKYAKDPQVEGFMKLMNDPATGVVYVHCKAGRHRTGLVGAIYRLEKYGWDYDKAYKEMKNYNYSSWPVHYNIKSYVQDYYKTNKDRIDAARAQAPAVPRDAAAAAKAGN
jgi:tyrosine-protein phosphatase SIW14